MRPHGTRAKYVVEKCRCEPCTTANRTYAREQQRRQRRVAYGIEDPDPNWVDPTEAREHLLWLRSQGLGTRTLMKVTGLGRSALQEISQGIPRRIAKKTADRILAASTVAKPRSALVDAGPTWKLLDDLIYLGFTRTRIAQELGAKTRALQLRRDQITHKNALKVKEIYELLIRETDDWHGDYAGYAKRGCRCLRCKATARQYSQARRERQPQERQTA